MACNPEILKDIPLFALLDDDETAVLASQVEVKKFASRERIYKLGAPGGQAYVMMSGKVRVSTVDEDGQELVENFYKALFSNSRRDQGIPYHERSAKALRSAVKKLRRKRHITLERWVNFVHYGA